MASEVVDPKVAAGNYMAMATWTDELIIKVHGPKSGEYYISLLNLVRGEGALSKESFIGVVESQLANVTARNDFHRVAFLQAIVNPASFTPAEHELFFSPYEIPVEIEEITIPEDATDEQKELLKAQIDALEIQRKELTAQAEKMCEFWQERVDMTEVRAIYDYFRELCKE